MDALDPSYLDAIKGFEGYSAQPYWDYKQSTSGYGTKAQPGDQNIPPDQLKQVHEQRFSNEIGNAAASVDAFAPNLPPGVRAALTSLTYNAGPSWQHYGLGDAIRSGDYDRAKQLFLEYNKAGGEVNQGLVNRRQQEAAWFGGGLPASSKGASKSLLGGLAGLLPQGMVPQFAQQAAENLAPAPAAPPMQVPPLQLNQIQYYPRRPVSLANLRAQLSAPSFKG